MKELLTLKEVQELTGLSPNTIRKRVQDGVFKTLPRNKNEKILIFKESIYGEKVGEGKTV